MASNDNSAPQYVELMVADTMYNVIIDDTVQGSHLELFSPDEVQSVMTEAARDGTVTSTSSGEMKNIRVYQAFKSGHQSSSRMSIPTLFKTVDSNDDCSDLANINDESAQAVKTILSPQHGQPDLNDQSLISFHPVDQPQVKAHKCPHCFYCASTSYNLKVHINNRHTKEVKFQCNQCSFLCYTKASLNYHLKSHNMDEYYNCSECSYKTHSRSGLLNHFKTHQKVKPFQCSYCPYAAARKMTLKEHIEVLHSKDKEVFNCELCSFQTIWSRALKKHMKQHNSDTFNCIKCNFLTSEKQKLLDHHVNAHGTQLEEYQCNECSFFSYQYYKLTEHVHRMHSSDNKTLLYSCPDCDYKTKWKRLIKGHRRIHTGEMFRCSKCDFATITKTRLTEHETTHLDMSERGFACPHCTYKASRLTRLNEHIVNRHYPNRKQVHKCETCGFTTLWKNYMKVHMRTHTGEVLKCSRCPYTTPVRSQMLRHEKSLHRANGKQSSGNNLYKCAHCPYTAARQAKLSEHIHLKHNDSNSDILCCSVCSFMTQWTNCLEEHMTLHENEWMRCEACDYKTTSIECFREHMNANHLENGYKCTLCSSVFENKEEFNNHLKSRHYFESKKPVTINYLDNNLELDEKYEHLCAFCEFSVGSKDALNGHLIVHVEDVIAQAATKEEKLVFNVITDGAFIPSTKQQILY